MTAIPLEQVTYPESPAQRADLTLVTSQFAETIPEEGAESRALFDTYFDLRDQAIAAPKVGGEELLDIQAAAATYALEAGWFDLPDALDKRVDAYTNFDSRAAYYRIADFVSYLERNFSDSINPVELEATRAFLDSTYAMYHDKPENGEVMADADGSFAFVVPARMGRGHPDYGQEVEPAIPALRYLPNELRAAMMMGLPPFVIDIYEQNGKRGYLMLASVFEDMKEDLGGNGELLRAARQNVNAAVDFAYRRFGVTVAGLGATLPALTQFGTKITNPNVITTTGHAGTVSLINATVEIATQGQELTTIGVLGLGSIGEAIARNVRHQHPNAKILAYEKNQVRAKKVLEANPALTAAESEKRVLEESQITISAITEQLDLDAMGVTKVGGNVVEDSQPGSIRPDQLKQFGRDLFWVIGNDPEGKTLRRRGYDYGTMVNPNSDVFGCEAEAASLARYRDELIERGTSDRVVARIMSKVALRGPVTMQHVRYVDALFNKYGIMPAAPQAFGKLVHID